MVVPILFSILKAAKLMIVAANDKMAWDREAKPFNGIAKPLIP